MSIEDVNVNESARAFIAKLERQQRDSSGPIGLTRDRSERARIFRLPASAIYNTIN
jgi:hypothetical protein